MELGLTEEQKMLRKVSRDFLETECPKSLVREMEEDETGFPGKLWHKMAALGWMGLPFPKEHGGSGGNYLDLIILLEEMGRALLPGPFFSTVVLGGFSVLMAGSEKQRYEILPRIAKGDLVLTLALTEPDATDNAIGIQAKATPDKDEYIIDGIKLFVPYAHVSDYIIFSARTKNSKVPENGISLFLTNAGSGGIQYTVLDTIAADKQCEVAFTNVRVPRENVLGDLHRGWASIEKITQRAEVAECALMVGGAQRVLEMSVEHAKTRIQFDRPLGTFESMQHRCADQMIDVEGARYTTYHAAWRISEDLPCAKEASIAKAWANEAYRRVCLEAHQTHGAIGYTREHDLGLYFRRAKAAELAFGDTDYHLEIVAQQLGL